VERRVLEEIRDRGDAGLLLKLKGLDTPEDVRSRSRWLIYLEEKETWTPEDPDVFLISELIDMTVFDMNTGQKVGVVSSFYERPGQDIIGILAGDREVLCPFVDPLVPKVDRVRREIFVQWSVLEPLS
jgi:16S rRNA processing protein RimM